MITWTTEQQFSAPARRHNLRFLLHQASRFGSSFRVFARLELRFYGNVHWRIFNALQRVGFIYRYTEYQHNNRRNRFCPVYNNHLEWGDLVKCVEYVFRTMDHQNASTSRLHREEGNYILLHERPGSVWSANEEKKND